MNVFMPLILFILSKTSAGSSSFIIAGTTTAFLWDRWAGRHQFKPWKIFYPHCNICLTNLHFVFLFILSSFMQYLYLRIHPDAVFWDFLPVGTQHPDRFALLCGFPGLYNISLADQICHAAFYLRRGYIILPRYTFHRFHESRLFVSSFHRRLQRRKNHIINRQVFLVFKRYFYGPVGAVL